jgi:FkbM family methyltransferase
MPNTEGQIQRLLRVGRFLVEADRKWRGRLLLGYARFVLQLRVGKAPKPAVIAGMTLDYGDPVLFRLTFREIFIARTYAVSTSAKRITKIIDAGANIGLATLFFAHEFPSAEIHCFEPSAVSFEFLQRNLVRNGVRAELHPYAVGAQDGEREFFYLEDTAGDIGHSMSRKLRDVFEDQEKLRSHYVQVRSLRPLLEQEVDILKLDIEGGEGELLPAIEDRLPIVRHVVMEFHHIPDSSLLGDTLNVFERAGHRYSIEGCPENSPGAVATIRTSNHAEMAAMSNHRSGTG